MKCAKCRVALPVIETRKAAAGVYRRRKCPRCDDVVTTLEQAVAESIAPVRAQLDKKRRGG